MSIALRSFRLFPLTTSLIVKQQLLPRIYTIPHSSQYIQFKLYATRSLIRSNTLNTKNTNAIKTPIANKSGINTSNTSKAETVKPTPTQPTNPPQTQEAQLSIFKRFKEAYNKHGRVLITVHLTSCVGWICGFYMLSKSGFDITSLFNIFEKMHIMSHETSISIEKKIHNFNLEAFLRNYHFDYVLNDSALVWLGKSITGITLKHVITAVMLYKLLTPLRYLFTITCTKVVIDLLKRRGVIPPRPPPGLSIKELYEEQKLVLDVV